MKVKEKKKEKKKDNWPAYFHWSEFEWSSWDITWKLHKTLIRPHMKCCVQFWSPAVGRMSKRRLLKTKSRFLTVFSKKERLGRLRLCPWSSEHWGMTLETIVKSWGADKVNSHCLYLSVESQTLEVYAERGKIFKRPEGGTFSHK